MKNKIQDFLTGKEKYTILKTDDYGNRVQVKKYFNVTVRLNGDIVEMHGIGSVDIKGAAVTVEGNNIRIKRKDFDNGDEILIS